MNRSFSRPVSRLLSSSLKSQQSTQSRGFAHYVGSWPGPNPLKDLAICLGGGFIAACLWKKWQIQDKADRLEYKAYIKKIQSEQRILPPEYFIKKAEEAAAAESAEESTPEATEESTEVAAVESQ